MPWLAAACVCAGVVRGGEQDTAAFKFEPEKNIIPAPADPAAWPAFRESLAKWREETRARLKYDDALYGRPEFAWSAANFSCCFLMLCDETFYDARQRPLHGGRVPRPRPAGVRRLRQRRAVARLPADRRGRAQPVRFLPRPAGRAAAACATSCINSSGAACKVYIDYNPWDTGTRREGKPDLDALVEMVQALDADGIFLDTMDKGAADSAPSSMPCGPA